MLTLSQESALELHRRGAAVGYRHVDPAMGKVRRCVVEVRTLTVASGSRRVTNLATAKADGVPTRTARASVTITAPPAVPGPATG
jgi:hypothetical protein